jgi:cytochrome c peroxidase
MRRIAAILAITLSLGSGLRAEERLLGLDLYRPAAENNELTPARIGLGEKLFRERSLSRDASLACVDCHQPGLAFTDGRAKAVGVFGRQGPRSVPTLINRAWGKAFFWDGRIPNLEQQVVQPILAKLEMDLTLEEAVERLQSSRRYRKAFNQVFGRDPNPEDP